MNLSRQANFAAHPDGVLLWHLLKSRVIRATRLGVVHTQIEVYRVDLL